MWKKLFEYHLRHDHMRSAMKVLLESVDILKDKALPLWKIMELNVLSTDEEMVYIVLNIS